MKKIKDFFTKKKDYNYLLKKYNTLELKHEVLQDEYKNAVYKEVIDLESKTEECDTLKEDIKKLKSKNRALRNELKDKKSK